MQRGIWTLAISGMMAFSQSGYAAGPNADQPQGRASVGTARVSGSNSANRNVKKPKTPEQNVSKNYYKDLFNEDAATPAAPAVKRSLPASTPLQTTMGDWDEDLLPTAPRSQFKAAEKKLESKFEEDDGAFDILAKSRRAKATEEFENVKPEGEVTQANFDRIPGKKPAVQQARNDGRPRSAPPMQATEEPLDKAARKFVAKDPKGQSFQEHESLPESPPVTTTIVSSGPQSPQVTVEWVKRGEFNVGQECLVELVVRNSGASHVSQVAVDGIFPTVVRLTAAEPKPSGVGTDRLTWTFDQLPPASEKKITVKLIPNQRGEIGATAQVRFTGVSTAAFTVSEPLLKVSVKSPSKEIMLGDPASQMITVTNPGTGTAQDVKIEAKLSDGLENTAGEDRLIIDVGAVGPGEIRTYRLPLTAAKGGSQSVSVVATSSSDASSTDSVEFTVIAPSLKIAIDGPALRYKGRNAKYSLTVTNDGSVVNNNIHISQVVADGFKFVAADHNGKFDASIKNIHWFVGRLEPGESTQVNCELQSQQIGEFTHSVKVVSDTGVQSDAQIETRVDGIASLTMELVDLDDPVETGSETGYEIRVKNDGSKVATGVTVSCELPAGMELLSAKAPVDEVLEGRQLTFKPIDQIAPGGQVTLRVLMKVNRDGSHRMRVRLTGGGLQEPVVLEEVTRAYSDGSN